MVPRISVAAGSEQQLHRFQTVIEHNWIVAFNKRRQIAGERHTGHLCPVAVCIVGAPAGLNGMQITCSERRTEKRMATIDPCVEQADARHFVNVGGKLGPLQQLVQPFLLFVRPQRIKELGCLLGSPKLRDAVERQHRALHLLQ